MTNSPTQPGIDGTELTVTRIGVRETPVELSSERTDAVILPLVAVTLVPAAREGDACGVNKNV
jgi:hypothetical protein